MLPVPSSDNLVCTGKISIVFLGLPNFKDNVLNLVFNSFAETLPSTNKYACIPPDLDLNGTNGKFQDLIFANTSLASSTDLILSTSIHP